MLSRLHQLRSLFVSSVAVLGMAVSGASAITVGAGTGIPLEAVDTPGANPRMNVDQSFTQVLQPGIYVVNEWSYAAGQAGNVTPFLATSSSADNYTVVAIGNEVTIAGAGTATAAFGRSNTVVITAPTTVFAGITSPTTQNPIFLDNGTGTQTDHDNSPTPIANPGNAISGFSNANLGRTYAFSLDVQTRTSPLRLGADIAIPKDELDNADGPRMNIDDSFKLVLGPGTYFVDDFSYASGREGLVTPFLAVLNANNEYVVIAQGDTQQTGAGVNNVTVDFGGTGVFQLFATTTVYAGITNPSGSNPIFLDNNSGFLTDHDGSPAALAGAGTLIPVSGISNNNLNRTYAFSIGITAAPVPEPATAALALMGLGGLMMRRRRQA